MPQEKGSGRQRASNWGGGVWQLAIVAAIAILYVMLTGPAKTDSQRAFREAFVVLSLMALLIAVVMQQLKRMREASGGYTSR
jgi:multisubunit Na+/H+ antiporter MnhB subunit